MSIRYKLLGYVCKGFPQGPPTASFSSSRVSIWQYICCQVIWNEQRDKIFIRCLFELIFKILETKPSLGNGQGEKTKNVNTIVKFASSTSLFASKSALNSHHCDELFIGRVLWHPTTVANAWNEDRHRQSAASSSEQTHKTVQTENQ